LQQRQSTFDLHLYYEQFVDNGSSFAHNYNWKIIIKGSGRKGLKIAKLFQRLAQAPDQNGKTRPGEV
jgi:hypothetical protein